MLAGQVIVGGCESSTVIVNEHIAFEGVSVHVTVVEPMLKNEPEGGVQFTVPHDPEVVGGGYVTVAPHWFVVFVVAMLPGQVNVQAPGRSVTETSSIFMPVLAFVLSVPTRHRSTIFWPFAEAGRLTVVVINVSVSPVHTCLPARGLVVIKVKVAV